MVRHLAKIAILLSLGCGISSGFADAALDTQIHDYILKNPEVLVQSLQSFQQKQMDQARKSVEQTQATAVKYADGLFRNAVDPVAGNAKGKVTIVEFFDNQCPHCLAMHPALESVIKSNPEVRVVYKEFPIRGEGSETAARAALAAMNQKKYTALHDALMKNEQLPLTDEMVFSMAKKAGLNMDKLKTDMKSEAISSQLKATFKLAQDLQLMGTPAIFIAKTDVATTAAPQSIVFIPGQVDQAQLAAIIKQMK